ncbi:MAG: hypothetical protein ACOZB0_04710 [Pseudomonadota bacterium]
MSLPSVACPCCNVQLPLEAWIAHAATREAFIALASLHPSQRLPMAAMRYVGLFAPTKQTMRWERIADLLVELRGLIAAGRVEHRHQSHPAPLDYWIDAMEEALSRRDSLNLPLGSHGYLKSIVLGYASKAGAQAERAAHDRLAGNTPVGAVSQPPTSGAESSQPSDRQRQRMPESIKAQLKQFQQPGLGPNPSTKGT